MSAGVGLRESCLKEALRRDKGPDAHLLRWQYENSIEAGSNFIGAVDTIGVTYSEASTEHKTTYFVKLMKSRENGEPTELDVITFTKEAKFFIEILPLLNAELTKAGQEPLHTPKYYFTSWAKGDNQQFFEDLHSRGFRMHDRKKGVDIPHATLVLQELARLHAASQLLQNQLQEKLEDKFDFLSWEWYNYSQESRKGYNTLITSTLTSLAGLAREVGDEEASRWYRDLAPRSLETVQKLIERSNVFEAVCHADCSIINMMFRYNDDGQPVEVMMIDFQVCRKSSLALDLTYFIFSSIDEPLRSSCVEELIELYHSSFSEVMEGANKTTPFTPDEVVKEFHATNTYGAIMGSVLLPIFVAPSTQDTADFDKMTGNQTDEFVDELDKKNKAMVRNNPLLPPRLHNMYATMRKFGIFKS